MNQNSQGTRPFSYFNKASGIFNVHHQREPSQTRASPERTVSYSPIRSENKIQNPQEARTVDIQITKRMRYPLSHAMQPLGFVQIQQLIKDRDLEIIYIDDELTCFKGVV